MTSIYKNMEELKADCNWLNYWPPWYPQSLDEVVIEECSRVKDCVSYYRHWVDGYMTPVRGQVYTQTISDYTKMLKTWKQEGRKFRVVYC